MKSSITSAYVFIEVAVGRMFFPNEKLLLMAGNLCISIVILEFGDDLTDIANQATIDRELPVSKCGFKTLDTLIDECKTFCYGFAFGQDQDANRRCALYRAASSD